MVPCDKNLRHDFLPGSRGIFYTPALTEDGLLLVEGVFNALAGLAGGRPCTAMVGLTMREEWWSAIPARSLILAVDNDAAGRQRWAALAQGATRAGKSVYVLKAVALEGFKDLNEYWVAKRHLPPSLQRNFPNASPIAFAP